MTFGGLLNMLFVPAVLVIALASLFFIVCRKYEEGTLGNFFLGLLVLACAIVLYEAVAGTLTPPEPLYVLMIECLALFMARHGYRFAMFHWHGWFGWQPPADMQARSAEH